MKQITLAQALLRRKELQEQVDRLRQINQRELFEDVFVRKAVSDSVDDIRAKIARVAFTDVTAAYDFYSKRLRQVDAIIQQANWNTNVDVEEHLLDDYTSPAPTK